MPLQAFSEYPRIHGNVLKSVELGNLAGLVAPTMGSDILLKKAAVDSQVVADLEKIGSRLLKSMQLAKSEDLGKLLALAGAGGLGVAGGAAYAGSRAEDAAKEQVNNAILSALGIGAAAYGLGRYAGRDGESSTKEGSDSASLLAKVAAAARVALDVREVVQSTRDADLQKYAAEVLVTANAHIVDMLSETLR